jgi:hypothetical protein
MMGTESIINPVAMLTAITKMDMMIIMVGTISIIDLIGMLTAITKSGMAIMAGTKSITNTGDITVKDMFTRRSTIITVTTTTVAWLRVKK